MILARQNPQPKITALDRLKLLFLARFLPHWTSLLRIVQPETLLRWHHDLFKHFWKQKSGTKHHPKRISDETIALIRQMAEENHLWGAERIRGNYSNWGLRWPNARFRNIYRKIGIHHIDAAAFFACDLCGWGK